jgi:hypothetical protein
MEAPIACMVRNRTSSRQRGISHRDFRIKDQARQEFKNSGVRWQGLVCEKPKLALGNDYGDIQCSTVGVGFRVGRDL